MTIEKRDHRAGYSGLQTCGWSGCVMCGPKIAAERAADIALALSAHHLAGGRVALATLTLPHTRADSLRGLLDGLGRAWTSIRSNKTPRRLLAAHTVGFVRRLEVTVGPNGWHPHLHVLLFLTPGTTDADVDRLGESMYGTWSGRLVRLGHGRPSREHGLDLKVLDLAAAHEHVAGYVAKAAAYELASAGTKIGRRTGSRTPAQLLYDLATIGEAADLARWLEYETTMHHRRHLEWSQGLRAQLIGDVAELTDEEAADATDGAARFIAAVGSDTWTRIRRSRTGPAAVLDAAEIYDDDDQARAAIAAHLQAHHLGRVSDAPT